MTTSELMEAMAKAGAPFEAILIAVRALEEKDADIAVREDRPRSNAALRQKRYREKKKAEKSIVVMGDDVTRDAMSDGSRDASCDDVTAEAEKAPTLPLPPNDLFSNPPTPTHPDIIPAREALPFDAHVDAWNEWMATKPKGKGGKRSTSSETPDRPDDVSEQVWADFLRHRRKHKADLTATALAGFRREADRVGWPLERAIEESILRNWRGFKAGWVKNDDRSEDVGASAARYHPGRGGGDGFTRALDRAEDALRRHPGAGMAQGASRALE